MRNIPLVILALALLLTGFTCKKRNTENLMPSMTQSSEKAELSALKCPVTGDAIPADGGQKFTYKGLKFTVCCTDCEKTIKENFEKYKKFGIKE